MIRFLVASSLLSTFNWSAFNSYTDFSNELFESSLLFGLIYDETNDLNTYYRLPSIYSDFYSLDISLAVSSTTHS